MARSSNTAATYQAQFHDGRPQFVDITAAANIAADAGGSGCQYGPGLHLPRGNRFRR